MNALTEYIYIYKQSLPNAVIGAAGVIKAHDKSNKPNQEVQKGASKKQRV